MVGHDLGRSYVVAGCGERPAKHASSLLRGARLRHHVGLVKSCIISGQWGRSRGSPCASCAPWSRQSPPPALTSRHLQVHGCSRIGLRAWPSGGSGCCSSFFIIRCISIGFGYCVSFTSVSTAVHRSGHLRLSQLPGGRTARPSWCPSSTEEHPQLPHPRLRQGLRQDVAPEGSPAVAHGREAVRLQLALLRQAIHEVRRAATSLAHPHGREAVRMSHVQQAVHALRPLAEARQDTQPQLRRWQVRHRRQE